MAILTLLVSVANLALGAWILSANRKVATNVSFSIFIFGMTGWIASIFTTVYLSPTLLWGRLAITTSIIGMTALLIFALVFPENKKLSRSQLLFIITPALLFFFLSFTNLMVERLWVERGFITGTFGPARKFYALFPPLYILSSIAILIKKYVRLKGFQKMQLRYVLTGIILTFIPILLTNAILPAFKIYKFNGVGPLFIIVLIGFTAYAIVRHQLMDVRIIVQRGIIYSGLLAVIVALYLGAILILGILFQKTTHIATFLAGLITAIAGIIGAHPLKNYFTRITDKIFFKDRYDYKEALHELSEILNHHIEEKDIIEKSTAALQRILRAGEVTFVLGLSDSAAHLAGASMRAPDTHAAFSIPIFIKKQIVGVLRLTEKKSGDEYSTEDIRLLHTFAHQFSVALEKTRLYEEVKRYSLELEARVAQRTAQLTALQETQHQMMVDVSHHLQTPLTILKSQLGSLRAQVSSHKTIDMVEKNIDDISSMLYNLLHLAELETSPESFLKDNVDLSKLLQDTLEYVTILTEEKNIKLEGTIEPDIHVIGRKDKLEEMITNLISNSIKYMRPRGTKKIFASLARDEQKRYAVFTLSDTGMGIPPEDMPHIFNRFYKAQGDMQTHAKGTGLGLSIVKKIVEKHNGAIEAKSIANKGTVFTITLPLAEQK